MAQSTKKKNVSSPIVSSLDQLGLALGKNEQELQFVLHDLTYQTFKVRKPNGGYRIIEDPNDELASAQKSIANYLNQIYSNYLPDGVHGYIPSKIMNTRRDIFTNAKAHLDHQHMYNVDLKDFFHSINTSMQKQTLKNCLPGVDLETISYISSVASYKERLPMGSPLSPVLSNMCCMDLDFGLSKLALKFDMTYTRYVDDITFSSDNNISAKLISKIKKCIKKSGFSINPKKEKLYTSGDPKEITGLLIDGGQIFATDKIIKSISGNIRKLKDIKETYDHLRILALSSDKLRSKKKFDKIKGQVKGQLNFLRRIDNSETSNYKLLKKQFKAIFKENSFIDQTVYI